MNEAGGTEAGTKLARVRTIARALDSAIAIPGTSFRVGLDPLLGLVPGLGDLAGAAASGYIVLTAMQLGVSRVVVMRMLANIAMDTLAGAIPVLGDLFDAGWKANNRNVALLERHIETTNASAIAPRAPNRYLMTAVVIALALAAGSAAILTIFGVRWLLNR